MYIYISVKCFCSVSVLYQLTVVLNFAKLSFRLLTSLLRLDTICNTFESWPSNSLTSPETEYNLKAISLYYFNCYFIYYYKTLITIDRPIHLECNG